MLIAIRNVARPPAAEEAARKLEPIFAAIVDRNRAALRADAIASIAFGLFTLYTVAAVLSRDRNGRRLALLTATSGIVFQLAELPLKMHIAKQTVAAGGCADPRVVRCRRRGRGAYREPRSSPR